MSNENQQPTPEVEQKPSSDKVSPFLSSPLPQGTPQGQQQSLQQGLASPPTGGSVPKYNLPRGANTGNVGATSTIAGALNQSLRNDFHHALDKMGVAEIDLSEVSVADAEGLALCRMAAEKRGVVVERLSPAIALLWKAA